MSQNKTGCGCCGGESCCDNPQDEARDEVKIDFLFLDLETCGRCRGTEDNLESAIDEVATVLGNAGYHVALNKTHISSMDLAIANRFLSSPTIRVNGKDISLEVTESDCTDCGDICGDSVDCRTWTYQGEQYDVPPKEMIVRAILSEVFSPSKDCETGDVEYRLPDNLRTFFNGK